MVNGNDYGFARSGPGCYDYKVKVNDGVENDYVVIGFCN